MDPQLVIFIAGALAGGVFTLVILAIIGGAMRKTGGNQKIGITETISFEARPGPPPEKQKPHGDFDESMGIEPPPLP